MSFFARKNLRFMACFYRSQFVNNSQRFCLCSCHSPRPDFFLFPLAFLIHSLLLNSLPRRSEAKMDQLTRLSTLFAPSHSSLFDPIRGYFHEKIRNFFTRPFCKISGKSGKKPRKNPANLPLKTRCF